MGVDVEVFVILIMIIVMHACVLQGVSATCETHLNLNLAKLAETGTKVIQTKVTRVILRPGLHKLWYPGIRDRSTWGKFGAHGEHGDVFLFSNLGAL